MGRGGAQLRSVGHFGVENALRWVHDLCTKRGGRGVCSGLRPAARERRFWHFVRVEASEGYGDDQLLQVPTTPSGHRAWLSQLPEHVLHIKSRLLNARASASG